MHIVPTPVRGLRETSPIECHSTDALRATILGPPLRRIGERIADEMELA